VGCLPAWARARQPHLPAMAVPAPSPAPRDGVRVVFGALMLVTLLAALDQTIVSTALPIMVGELGGVAHLSWVVTAYLLTSTVAGPIYAKLGDLYGRKPVLQAAIVVFLVGSALCGLSRSMLGLIAFRALQGLGGGGLMVTSQAVVADLIPPRDRGRYQGVFGAVFALATLVGPLAGGFFVQHLSWRWIFYVNLPLGLLALAAIAVALRAPVRRRRRPIDWAGAVTLAAALSCLVLLTSMWGSAGPGRAPWLLALGGLAAALAVAFVYIERRAAEPLLPLALFREPVFLVASTVGFMVGLIMFGTVTYLPLYLQVARGASPSGSGLQLAPLMGGMLLTSVASGRLISRWGRYRPFPIAGMAITTVGLVLLTRVGSQTPTSTSASDMLVVGLGLGMVMQVLVLAVQNAVRYEHLGVATSGATLFRMIGGSLGVSLFGALFVHRLGQELTASLGPAVTSTLGPAQIQALPPAVHAVYVEAFSTAVRTVFRLAALGGLLGTCLALFLRERPLRRTVGADGLGESFAMPRTGDSLPELERALSTLAARENRWQVYQRLAARAHLDLEPPQLWLLARIGERAPVDLAALASGLRLGEPEVAAHLAGLERAGLLSAADGGLHLSEQGRAVMERVTHARQQALSEMLAGWAPERHPEVTRLVNQLARSLASEIPTVPARA
jgi:EmrB/QacA subfamily drug resistance transporter